MNSSTVSKHGNKSISETMCKYVLKTIVRYAEEHDLDRQTEIQELLEPVERHAEKRNNKAALNQVLPFYIGYAATIIVSVWPFHIFQSRSQKMCNAPCNSGIPAARSCLTLFLFLLFAD